MVVTLMIKKLAKSGVELYAAPTPAVASLLSNIYGTGAGDS